MQEQIFTATNGVQVKYKHKHGKYDFNHLIIVFSGFLNETPGNYDFIRALNDCPCNVIWISDDFESMYSYYLCINMDFKIETAVTEFINYQTQSKNLSLSDVTVTGFSKGGTAALYYGLKLNISNIVTTVPQVYIGSYVNDYWKPTAKHMIGESYSKIDIQYLDNLIPRLLKSDTNLQRNIYLLTSEADTQYYSHINPILSDFDKYSNFNLLKTYSLFVRQHNQVTGHHTSLLLSIYYALASEAVPRFNNGEVNFFGSQPAGGLEPTLEPYVDLKKVNIIDNKIYIEGVALIRGVNAAEYSDIDYELIFEGDNNYIKKLAKANRPNLTREYFDNKIVVYDKCWFTTSGYSGIDISDIEKGSYTLHIKIKTSKSTATVKLVSNTKIDNLEKSFSFTSGANNNCLNII